MNAIGKLKKDEYNALPCIERARYMAGGRATVGTITQLEDKKLVTSYVGKVHGKIISGADGIYKFTNRAEALQCACEFIAHAKNEVERLEQETTK